MPAAIASSARSARWNGNGLSRPRPEARPRRRREGASARARRGARGRVSVREAVEIARQIAAGLHAAHTAGFVHRDLKPANVILLVLRELR
ncbi:MAG TPA: hypothetical protein VL308_24070 [Gemmatimonadaceae bacterium]|nr:hypothetical protein [Gemmatimonadaceae bacterium]